MNTCARLIGALFVAVAALGAVVSAQGPAIVARTVEDRDHVTVMELTGAYDRQTDANRQHEIAIRQAIAREFLRTHADAYDFIVTFSGFPYNLGSDEEGTRVGGRYYEIKNDTRGIGRELFDESAAWGSTGRLQGYIDMGALASLTTDPTDPNFERTLGTLAHEFAHRWAAHLRFRDTDGSSSSTLLSADAAHWSFFLQSHNSVLYGNDWRDNRNGTFTSVGRSRSFYSPLDLYAMGLLDASQVQPFFLIDGASGDPSRLPELGVTVNGTRKGVTIDDVIAVEGNRIPSFADSPKQFKVAFVFLARPGQDVDGVQLRAINNVRAAFATRMTILTNGKAIVEVFPDDRDTAPLPPGPMLPPSSGPRVSPVDAPQGVSWLMMRQRADGSFMDSPATRVRDTAAVLDLLAGEPAAFPAQQAALGWLVGLNHSSNVDTVARRLAAIAPQYSAADNAFLLAAQHARGGWGLRAGDEADPFDTALALAALREADAGPAIDRLLAAQRPDGSWPLHPGGPGSIQATLAALALGGRFASTPLGDALTRAASWLETRQNNDGGFGESGSTIYETAASLIFLSRISSTRADLRWAVEFLNRGQLADGSWNESVYETALAVRALRIGELPNLALVPATLTFSPADPVEGETVTISAQLANAGSLDASNVVVRFFDGDPAEGGLPIGDASVTALPAQARIPVSIAWSTTERSGPHTIVAMVDYARALSESNEADNLASGALSVRPPPVEPDLAVTTSALAFTPDALRAVPQVQHVQVRVANLGRTAVAQARVVLFAGDPAAGGAQIGEALVDVGARSGVDVSFDFSVDAPGERRYFVAVDPGNGVAEADESNNQASRVLPVESTVDLVATPGSVAFSRNPIALGQDLALSAAVGNTGTADAFGVRIRLFVDDPAGAIDIATLTRDLPAGQTIQVAATWRTSRPLVNVPVVVHVDSANAFGETSEANNRSSAPLSVPEATDANLYVTHQELQVTSPVLQGGSSTISIPVHNTGVAEAQNVGVAFYIGVPASGGVQVGSTQTIASLPPGGQAVASVVWDSIATFGDKLVYVVVDPAGAVLEFDEDDNTAFITVDALALPDVAVSTTAISFVPPFPRQGEPVVISALISNLGEQTAANVAVRFFAGNPSAGGVQIGADRFVTVAPVSPAVVQMPFELTTLPGITAIFVQVDALGTVAELEEDNNLASRSLGIQNGTVYFSNLYFSPNGDGVQDTTEFFFRLNGPDPAVAIRALNREGETVRELSLEAPALAGSIEWNGRDGNARIAPDGEYRFVAIGAGGGDLASATVALDNNNLPVGDAVGSKYLLQSNLTCDATGPASVGQNAPSHDHQTAGWLADDSGLLTWVSTQLQCAQLTNTPGSYLNRCGNYQFLSSPETGVYVTSPDGRTRTRITPASWAQRGPGGATSFGGTSTAGTYVIGAVASPDGRKVVVATRKYRYYPVACGNCGGLPLYHFEWREQIEPAPQSPIRLWALNTDGSGLVDLGTVPADDQFGLRWPSMPDVVWSPNGHYVSIWYYRFATSQYVIDVARTDGSRRLEAATSAPGTFLGNRDMAWTPDSSRLVYLQGNHSTGVYLWFAVTPDGVTTQTGLPTGYPYGGGDGVLPGNGMWLGNDRFADNRYDSMVQAQTLTLYSITGEAPRVLATHVDEAVVAPDGRSIVYVDSLGGQETEDLGFFLIKKRQTLGIFQVDADGNVEQLYASAPLNLGIDELALTRDGRRVAFAEHVATRMEWRWDPGQEGPTFIGDDFYALGAIDMVDRSVRVVETTPDASWDNRYEIAGFFPDGNSFLLYENGEQGGQRLVALGIDDGKRRVLFDDEHWYGASVGFTRSGKYYLFESRREAFQSGMACYKNGQPDTWILGSLLNLTTDFTFKREQSQLVIKGTAEDRHFSGYTLEAASTSTPGQWMPIAAPSETPVINDVLATWIPPSDGSFIVRLTATDLAGNRSTTRKRITWGLTPSITNVQVAPRVFSPNGDGSRDSTSINYTVLGPVTLQFVIYNAQNAAVRTIDQSHELIGPASFLWDGRMDAGQVVVEGVYRIHVLDYDFFVTVDTLPPDVGLTLGSAFRTVSQKTACVQTPQGLQCTTFQGPVVDTPAHALVGRAYDASLASWTLEIGDGANPAEWVVVNQGTDLLVARDNLNRPATPVADTVVRALPDAREVVRKRYRLTAVDQAGNQTRVVSDLAPQEIILFAWDGVPVPTTRALDQSLGPHTLAVLQTVRAPLQALTLQYRIAGSEVWVGGPAIAQPPAAVDFSWDNSLLAGGRSYEVRLVGVDTGGSQYVSNVVTIRSDLFEFTNAETNLFQRFSRAHGLASVREALTEIRLVMAVAGDPEIGVTVADFSDPVTFTILVAPDPSITSCAGQTVPARFKAIGESGRVYYSNTRTVTRFGRPDRPCSSVDRGAVLELSAARVAAENCGLPNPERVLIQLTGMGGIAPDSVRLAIQDMPNGLLPEPSPVTLPFSQELDTSQRAAGTYHLRATAQATNGALVTATATFVVDHAPPTAQVTYPAANTAICPARAGNRLVIAIEGIAEDQNFDHYALEYSVGEGPELWVPLFPSPQSESEREASRLPKRGVLANFDVTTLGGGTYSIRLKVFDKGGNVQCHTVTFTVLGGSGLDDVAVDDRIISPNADGEHDSVEIGFTLGAASLVDVQIFAVEGGQRAPTAVRTLLANAQQLAGSNAIVWDGMADLGGAVPDGIYHVVVTARDACNNAISDFAEIEVDDTPPDASIAFPLTGEMSRVIVDVRGNAADRNFAGYQLEVGQGETPDAWTMVKAGGAPVSSGLLGTWNTRAEPGAYTIRLTASDVAGNDRVAHVLVSVPDTNPLIPSITASPPIFSPNGDGTLDAVTVAYVTTAAADVTIEAVAGDTVVATVLSQSDVPPGTHTTAWNGLDNGGERAADGEYGLRVTATAAADPGRVQTEIVPVVVDTTAPAIVIAAPVGDAHLRGDVPVAGELVDANISAYSVSYGAASAAPTIVLDEGQQSRTGYTFGTLRDLADGIYRIRVSASDLAGNSVTLDRTFTVDGQSPTVDLLTPAAGEVIGATAPVVAVTGSIAEPHLDNWALRFGAGLQPTQWTDLTMQTTPASGQLATWDTSGLADGTYTLLLRATDRAGSTAEDRTQVVVDHTAPTAVIRQPATGARLNAPFVIRADANDANFTSATLEMSVGSADTAQQFVTLTTLDTPVNDAAIFDIPFLPADGTYTFRLTVEDAAGQRTERSSTVIIDTEPLAAPTDLSAVLEGGSSARLAWQAVAAADLAGYHVYRGGFRITAQAVQTNTYLDPNLTDGVHTYTVRAVDLGGLDSAHSNDASVAIDRTPPAARIQSPATGSAVGAVGDVVEIRGTAASADDFHEYRVYVGAGAAPSPGAFTLIRRSPVSVSGGLLAEWDANRLAPGAVMTLRLEAEDVSGNIASDQVTVTIDNSVAPGAPVLLSVVQTGTALTVTWQPPADTDIAGYLVYNGDVLANARRVVTGSLTPYLVPGAAYIDAGLDDGMYTYYVVAVDKAGNESAPSNTLQVRLDARAPRLTIIRPLGNPRVDMPVELEATSPDRDVASVQFQVRAFLAGFQPWNNLGAPLTGPPYVVTWDPRGYGLHSWLFRAIGTDTQGNTDVDPPQIVITHADVTPPETPTNVAAAVNESTVTLTWVRSLAADVTGYNVYRISGTNRQFVGSANSGSATFFVNMNVPEGAYDYVVLARDSGSNASIDSNLAAASVYAPVLSVPASCTSDPHTTITGTGAVPGDTLTLYLAMSQTIIATTTAAQDGIFTFANVPLIGGANTFTAQGRDAAGNVSKRSTSLIVTTSALPGEVTSLQADSAEAGTAFDVTLTWPPASPVTAYMVTRNGFAIGPPAETTAAATATVSSEYYPASQAIDGDPSTYWYPAYWMDPLPWFQIEYAEPIPFRGLRINWLPGYRPRDFSVEYWDGATWRSIATIQNNQLDLNLVTTEGPIVASRFRISTAVLNSYVVIITEVDALVGGPTTDTTLIDRGVPRGVHHYIVTPVNACGVEGGAASADVSLGDVEPPAPPLNLSATVVNHNVSLAWTEAEGETTAGYHVYRRTQDTEWVRLTSQPIAVAAYEDAAVPNGAYRYRVTALDSVGNESAPSNESDAVVAVPGPKAPQNLAATVTLRDVSLAWTAAADAAGYHVYRRGADPEWSRLTASPIAVTTYPDPLRPDGVYRYRVTAVDAFDLEGDPSNEAEAIVAVPPPGAPVLAVSAPPSGAALDLSWIPSAEGAPATRFEVLRSQTAGGPYEVRQQEIDGTTWRDEEVINGLTYFYVVHAVDHFGARSVASNEASGTPADLLAPGRPVLLSPTVAGQPVRVTTGDTQVTGHAEPRSAVMLVRDAVSLGTTTASESVQDDTFQGASSFSGRTVHAGRSLMVSFTRSSPFGSRMLAVTNLATHETRFFEDITGGADPRFSGDASRIAYLDGESVRVIDATTGSLLYSIDFTGSMQDLAFAADGTRAVVVMYSYDDGSYQSWLVNFATGERTQLDEVTWSPAWSSDGTRLLYTNEQNALRLLTLSSADVVTIDDTGASDPVFSPDGTRVAFVSWRGGAGADIWLWDVVAGALSALPPDDGPFYRVRPAFAPDGSAIAYLAQEDGGGDYTLRTRRLESGEPFDVGFVSDDDPLFWSADHSLTVIDGSDVRRYLLPGRFEFDGVPLDPGPNVFSAIATDAAGNASQPAAPITVTLDTAGLPDLSIFDADVVVYPLFPAPGDHVQVAATVRNIGAASASSVTVSLFASDAQGNVTQVGSLQELGDIGGGQRRTTAFEWIPAGEGLHQLSARVDPIAAVREASEANNVGLREISVATVAVPTVRVAVDRSSYDAGATVEATSVAANPGITADFTLELAVEDTLGNPVTRLMQQALPSFPFGTREFRATWPAGDALAGGYRARATFRRADGTTATAVADFTILADEHVTLSVSTDRAVYVIGEDTRIAGVVRNDSTNVDVSPVSAAIDVLAADGSLVHHTDVTLGTLLIGAQAQAPATFRATVPGAYTARLIAKAGDRVLGEATRVFVVNGTARVTGSMQVGVPSVPLGATLDVTATAVNAGTLDLAALPLRLRFLDPGTQLTLRTFERAVDLAVGQSTAWSVSIDTSGIPVGSYSIAFDADVPGNSIVPLANASVTILDVDAPAVQVLSPVADLYTKTDVIILARAIDNASGIARVEVKIDGDPWQQMAIGDPAAGTWSLSYRATAATEGSHTATIRAFDVAGNGDATSTTDPNPVTLPFTIDVTPPAISIAGVDDGARYAAAVTPTIAIDDAGLQSSSTLLNGAPFVSGTTIDADGAYTLIVTAADRAANSASRSVSFTIARNRPPSVSPALVTTLEDVAVGVVLTASDPDGDVLSYGVTAPAHGTLSGTAPNLTYTPHADFHGHDGFTVTVSDGQESAAADIVITVTPVNDRPVALAGEDQTVDVGTLVTLDGSGSFDPDGDALQWQWSQVSGVPVTLAGTNSAHPSFTAPDVAVDGTVLTFQLIVSDGQAASEAVLANVFVKRVNRAPVADAGAPQQVNAGKVVRLDGLASYDPDGDPLSYRWAQMSGVQADLFGADTAQPWFTAPFVPAVSILEFELRVSDGVAESIDTVAITVQPFSNHVPASNAGPDQVVAENTSVRLYGVESSDPDGHPLTYRWTQIAGMPVTLSDATSPTPSFTSPDVSFAGETLTFSLVVSDGYVDSAADTVDIRIVDPAAGPFCGDATPSPAVLWPPNHKMVKVNIAGLVAPGAPNGVTVVIERVYQDEPVIGIGSGDFGPDAIVDESGVSLRAERSGSGNGRVYNIVFKASRPDGQSCRGSVFVQVPHDAHRPAVNEGNLYRSESVPSGKEK